MDGGGSCVWIAKTGEMRFVLLQRPSGSDDKQMKQYGCRITLGSFDDKIEEEYIYYSQEDFWAKKLFNPTKYEDIFFKYNKYFFFYHFVKLCSFNSTKILKKSMPFRLC